MVGSELSWRGKPARSTLYRLVTLDLLQGSQYQTEAAVGMDRCYRADLGAAMSTRRKNSTVRGKISFLFTSGKPEAHGKNAFDTSVCEMKSLPMNPDFLRFVGSAQLTFGGFTHASLMKTLVLLALLGGFTICLAAPPESSAPLQPGERSGSATIIRRVDVLPDLSTNGAARGGLWPLYSSAEARLNYFAVAGRTPLHFHPDGDHRLYVLEGKVVVTGGTNITTAAAGDFIVIPKGVRHCYDVPVKGAQALLLTFDAPPYDPRKTVNVEGPK